MHWAHAAKQKDGETVLRTVPDYVKVSGVMVGAHGTVQHVQHV